MLSLAERPALGAVPLGVVPFVVADGIVKMVRNKKSGKPNDISYCNCFGVWPTQLGIISGESWLKKSSLHQMRKEMDCKNTASFAGAAVEGGGERIES
jgi:hypothetical protein